jgi:ribonuclease T1
VLRTWLRPLRAWWGVLGLWLGVCALALARGPLDDSVALAELPPEARQVMQLIRQGGPFPYEKDGTVFANRERLLPPAKRGYYREYTVPTPGLKHRGARRIVCGGWTPTVPDACYYTADHYASFRRIVP